MTGRPRIFTDLEGRRMLGATAVIRNEPSCSNGGCHSQADVQSVLGVLDIVFPLAGIDREIRNNTLTVISLALAFVAAVAVLVTILVNRMVYLPLRDLEAGAERLAEGDLEHAIPVRSEDEFGQLAASFNSMMAALRKSHRELREWGEKLEEKSWPRWAFWQQASRMN
jgi:two-component system NtrC family sensor kinase